LPTVTPAFVLIEPPAGLVQVSVYAVVDVGETEIDPAATPATGAIA
jgi:hypothetical protein